MDLKKHKYIILIEQLGEISNKIVKSRKYSQQFIVCTYQTNSARVVTQIHKSFDLKKKVKHKKFVLFLNKSVNLYN